MEATLFKQVGYSLSKLIEDIDIGEIGLPDIQRPFVWTTAKVRDLFDSMYKVFPVGYLLFWINSLNGNPRQIGIDAKQKAPRLLIVAGQQRLTTLCAVLRGRNIIRSDYTEQSIRIAFRPCDARFEVTDATIRKDPEFIHKISELWSGEHTRNRVAENLFMLLVQHIRSQGNQAKFYQKTFTHDDHAGMVYRTMGEPLGETTIIKRCSKEDSYENRRLMGTLPVSKSPQPKKKKQDLSTFPIEREKVSERQLG